MLEALICHFTRERHEFYRFDPGVYAVSVFGIARMDPVNFPIIDTAISRLPSEGRRNEEVDIFRGADR
jgi:hypothetical protein